MISELLINCVSVISCFYMQHTLGCLALLAGQQAVFDSTKYTMDLTQGISTFFRNGCVLLKERIKTNTHTLGQCQPYNTLLPTKGPFSFPIKGRRAAKLHFGRRSMAPHGTTESVVPTDRDSAKRVGWYLVDGR